MSEEMIIRHCSPTLAGIKTGSLFTCGYACRAELLEAVRSFNRRFSHKGVRVLPLKYDGKRALIYIYRPRRLATDLESEAACGILQGLGYEKMTPCGCISRLVRRMNECDSFPHEVGLFLGYPPEDVCGFIENKACGCKCVGQWKVYGDVDAAKKLFDGYKKCTRIYSEQFKKGKTIERLTVVG